MSRAPALLLALALALATAHGYYIPGTYPKEFKELDDLPGAPARRWGPASSAWPCAPTFASATVFQHTRDAGPA